MKRLLFLTLSIVFLFANSETFAQGIKTFKLTSITVSHGKTPLSSGLDTSILMTSPSNERKIEFTANTDRAYLIYSIPVKKGVYFEGTLGVKNNTPWAGPKMTATLGKWKIVLWTVVSAGWAGDPDWTARSLLDYESISYAANSHLEFGFASVRYQKDDRKNIPSFSYKLPIGPTEIKGQVSYDLTNDDPMFWLGIKYLFGK